MHFSNWQEFSKVSVIVISRCQASSKLTSENFYLCVADVLAFFLFFTDFAGVVANVVGVAALCMYRETHA